MTLHDDGHPESSQDDVESTEEGAMVEIWLLTPRVRWTEMEPLEI